MKDSNFLKENNARHMWHPMGAPRDSLENPPAIITEAKGVRIKDIDGHWMVDGVAGLWNVNLGYSCEPVKRAIAGQLDRLPYYSTFAGTSNDAAIELSWELRQFFEPDGMVRAMFTSGGSDSVETCLRLARQFHKLNGAPTRTKFLSLKKGYHGTHFGGASVNGNNRFRTAYEPLLPGCFHIPAPHAYRNPFGETDPARVAALCLKAARDEIEFQGPETIAAFIMEPVLGAGGIIVPHESFMPGMRALCDEYGILMISDEVITGFGRLGDWSGARHWGVQPDMMSVAKAITNGYFPFGAALMSQKIADVFEADETGKAALGHGYTYAAHPTGAAAALACIAETRKANVVANAAARGTQMFEGLKALQAKYQLIGDVRGGHGLMTAIELVSDRDDKTPVGKDVMSTIHRTAYGKGAMLRIGGHQFLFSPPLVISEDEVGIILDAVDAGLAAV